MTELDPSADKPIFEQYPEWDIEPATPMGWTATKATNDGRGIHTVAAPTITELRAKLQEITGRKPSGRPRPYIPAT